MRSSTQGLRFCFVSEVKAERLREKGKEYILFFICRTNLERFPEQEPNGTTKTVILALSLKIQTINFGL